MAVSNDNSAGTFGFWGLGLVGGAVIALVMGVLGITGWLGAILVGTLVFLLAGVLLSALVGAPLPSLTEIEARRAAGAPGTAAAPPAPTVTGPAIEKRQADPEPGGVFAEAKAAIAEAGAKTKAAIADTATRAKDAVTDAVASARDSVDESTRPHRAAAAGKAEDMKTFARETAQSARTSVVDAADAATQKMTDARRSVAGAIDPDGDTGTRPVLLSAARTGGPDNLKEIKGVGPKLEQTLHAMGIYHFDQVAGWGPDELAWVDANLEGFKGRASRDDWVPQARILAAGGDTDFSKKVDKGGVY